MSYPQQPGPGYPQQPGWNGPPQQFGPPVQWGGPPPPPRRGGAPWWVVGVLATVVVALAAGLLAVVLTGGSRGSTQSIELPDEIDGIGLADPQEVDREATRAAILEDTGAAGDVAAYDDDGDELTVYVIRKEGIGSYNTVPEDEDDRRFEVRKNGEVRCNVELADEDDDDGEDRVYGCDRTGPSLTVQVSSLDLDQDRQVKIVNELWEEFS